MNGMFLNYSLFTVLRSATRFIHKGWYEIPLIFLLLILTLVFKGYNGKFITGDGQGYYAYLPNIFIYREPDFSFSLHLQEKYYGKEHVADFRKNIDGRFVDKYFSGVSLLWMPFFLIAHWIAWLFSVPDGYAPPYQYMIALSALFYLALGLYFLHRLLISYGISGKMAGLISMIIVSGTNLSYYVLFDASYTHVYSFSLVAAFMFYVRKYFFHDTMRSLYKAVFIFSLIVAIRPVNVLVLLAVPFLVEERSRFFNRLRCLKLYHFFILFLLLCPVAVYQMLWWKVQTGHWLVYSYAGESFDLLHPHMLAFLFSYKKGVFIYAPLLFLIIPGLMYYGSKRLFMLFSWLFPFILIVYIFSSWQPWWYGMSYGARPVIDYYAFFAIPLADGLYHTKRKLRVLLFFLAFLFVCLNIVQEYQYKTFILHWENMSRQSYWKVFLRTGKNWRGYLWK